MGRGVDRGERVLNTKSWANRLVLSENDILGVIVGPVIFHLYLTLEHPVLMRPDFNGLSLVLGIVKGRDISISSPY